MSLIPEDPKPITKRAKKRAKKAKLLSKTGKNEDPVEEVTEPVASAPAEEDEKTIIYDDEGNFVESIGADNDVDMDDGDDKNTQEKSASNTVEPKSNNNKSESKSDKDDKLTEKEASQSTNDTPQPSKQKPDPEKIKELREKLASKIQQFKEKRKAPGTVTNGTVRTREAILAARREKEKREKEKAARRKERAQKEDANDENDDDYEQTKVDDSNLLFSQVTFADGSKATADLKELRHERSKKGPRDILGQLKHVQAQKSKIASKKDSEARATLESKSTWSKAIAQAEGIKIQDDEKKLKASLKKHKKQKQKSEKEWQERKETVAKDQLAKQQRRQDHIALKIERSKLHGKKAKKRAGFEGGIAKTRLKKLKAASSRVHKK